MSNKAFNTDYRYHLHKLSVGKVSLKLKLQHSKRDNSKIKNKLNNISINNDNNINNSKINNNSSLMNKNKKLSAHSKDKKSIKNIKNLKNINARSKILSIISNNNDMLNINNYLTNDNINNKNISNDINISNNENANNSYIHITLNSNNPYSNPNEEKDNNNNNNNNNNKNNINNNSNNNNINYNNNKYNNSNNNNFNNDNSNNFNNNNNNCNNNNDYNNFNNNNKNFLSVDSKYNITVNKKKQISNIDNNNNINSNNNNNSNNNYIKEKITIREPKRNSVIVNNKRDINSKIKQDSLILNQKIYSKEKNNSNSNYNKKKSHSPLESTGLKHPHKISNISLNNNNFKYNGVNNHLNKNSIHISQKMKNNISNVNIISYNTNIPNYNNNYNNNNNNSNQINNNRLSTNPDEEEFFEYNHEKSQELTKDEKAIYGDRIMKGYIKIKLLGKGGCGIVWLCSSSNKTGSFFNDNNRLKNDSIDNNIIENEECAVKQISKKGGLMNMTNENINTAKNEIKILCKLNNNENNIFIPKIYDYYEDNHDIWFSFEKGGISISGLCFKIKGEFEKGERIYLIQKGKFLMSLFSTISQFKYLLKSLLSGIDYINKKGIIHSDIKPENILIEYKGDSNGKNFEIKSIKIIDFGSAFFINSTATISSNTPEYLCPEITIANKKFIKELKNNNIKYVNCVDIWSLGITFLELCLCCPTWMSYKTKVIINGKTYHSSGLFGCRGRDGSKIYQKQIELTKNINKKLKNSMLYLFQQNDRDNFIDLLKKMLEFDYKKRITCQDAINHPFFKD